MITARTSGRLAALVAAALLAASAPALATETPTHVEGELASGATWVMDVPENWNGTLLLFSHGYQAAGGPNPAENAPSDEAARIALDEGYALIGSSYATTGWAVEQAVPDQLATIDEFTARFGPARRTIAWGQSYGGLVTTTIAERHPDRVDATLSMCGLVQGGVANWNSTLDPAYAVKTLLAPESDYPLTGFADAQQASQAATAMTGVVERAQTTPQGRARIALAAALHNIPGHNDPAQPEPGERDWEAQQRNQYEVMTRFPVTAMQWRQEAESRAGGNMSWNTGVDYARMLADSPHAPEIAALYDAAGLSLRDDLDALARAPRIEADPGAVDYMTRHVAFTGRLSAPQLDIHTTGDGLVPVQVTSAHRDAVERAGSGDLLRQAFVDRPGHCTFTAGEQLAALHALETRLDDGVWRGTDPAELNAAAEAEQPGAGHAYLRFRPTPYPRPYDLAE
ncbi:alpha/beta hydrolase family protein [Saccharopolyspora flava]|uniref:Alpha/beta hydrolase family protein n=1 Tax=Saccharopolyspora flava TaxID=95161 RepID=A0A1I6TLB3_9PSEU|nr:prolyl oligopeptidase family serine peptidase [Saccharopolyspora flava]SFS89797.1 Alpha/beta hydrolase family protein [Saccharopolyspora flava]